MFAELELAVPYYTSVMRRLQDMDCVKQLRRGGGNAVSIWGLIRPPTQELFETAADSRPPPTRKKPISEVLQQQIRDLTARQSRLEQQVELLQAVVLGSEGGDQLAG